MKTTILSFAFIFLCFFTFSQPFKSIFASDTTQWNVFKCIPDGGGTIAYYSFSDSIINQKKYHILYREDIYNQDQKITYQGELCGFIHEDTILGKYWFLKTLNNEPKEALFMNLSLEKGDTFGIISDFRDMNVDSVLVDSIYYQNSNKVVSLHKLQYSCQLYGVNTEFIESIGSSNGFYMGDMWEEPHPYVLVCKFENGNQVYSSVFDNNGNCFLMGGGSVESTQFDKSISIYPNPSSKSINIEVNEFTQNLDYLITNSAGIELQKGQLKSNITEINIIESGLYFIIVSDKENRTTKKAIINGY